MISWRLSWQKWLIFGLLLLGFFLRFWHFAQFPVGGETQDETAWTMLGSSLIQTGVPHSWSYFKGYTVDKVIGDVDSAQFTIVHPALDHPPLFGLLPGLVQTLKGQSWDSAPSFVAIRFPMVILAGINLVLFYIWIREAFEDETTHLIGVVIAATAPAWVFLSRMVVSENLLVTWLLCLLICHTTKLIPVKWRYIGMLVFCAALPLTKVAGIPLAAAGIFFSFIEKDWQTFRWQLIGLIVGIGIWFGYAAWFDFGLFLSIQTQQASRDTGLLTFFSTFFWSRSLVEKPFADIWNFLGLAGVIAISALGAEKSKLMKNNRQITLVSISAIAYIGFLLISVGETTFHGWYHAPLWPLFAFALTWILSSILKSGRIFLLTFIAFVSLTQIRLGLFYTIGSTFFSQQVTVNKVLLIAIGAAFAGYWLIREQKRQKFLQAFFWVWLLFLLVSNILTVLNIQQQTYWQDALYLEQGLRT